jgi:hypothetical protein
MTGLTKRVHCDRVAEGMTVEGEIRGERWRESGLLWVGWSVDKDGVRVRAFGGHRDVSRQHTAEGEIQDIEVNVILSRTTKRIREVFDKVLMHSFTAPTGHITLTG